MEFQDEANPRSRIMYHPDLGWGLYTDYGHGEFERTDDLTRSEVEECIELFGYTKVKEV
jgi:hypothetical protein